MNAEAFRWDYRNQQVGVVSFDNVGAPNFLEQNAGAASLVGGSREGRARITQADTVHAYAEYNHAWYGRFSFDTAAPTFDPASTPCAYGAAHPNSGGFPVITVDCAGYPLARAPLWTGSAGWDHRFRLPNGAALSASASAQFASARWATTDFTPYERLARYLIGNLDLTYTPYSARWSVSAYVHNLSNEAVYTGGVQQTFAPPQTYLTIKGAAHLRRESYGAVPLKS